MIRYHSHNAIYWYHLSLLICEGNPNIFGCSAQGDVCTIVKAPIHEATLLLATVACNNVAVCMMQCCVVACCWQLLLTFRLQFYFRATVAEKIKGTDIYVTSVSNSARASALHHVLRLRLNGRFTRELVRSVLFVCATVSDGHK